MFMTCAEWRSGLSRWGTYAQRPEVRILFPQQTPFVAPNKLIINNLKFFKYEKSNYVVKKAAERYFEQSSKSYVWLVSGTIPPPNKGLE